MDCGSRDRRSFHRDSGPSTNSDGLGFRRCAYGLVLAGSRSTRSCLPRICEHGSARHRGPVDALLCVAFMWSRRLDWSATTWKCPE